MSTDQVSLLSLEILYGPVYFGIVICTALYGVTCMQTYLYYVHYQKDPMRTKCLVAVLWMSDTIHEALSFVSIYKYTMAGLVHPESLENANAEFIMRVFFTALAVASSQGFFVYRIYLFSGRNILVPIVWVSLAIIQIAAALSYVAKAIYIGPNGVEVVPILVLGGKTFSNLATVTLAVGGGVEGLIAIFLTFLLIRKRSSIAFSGTADTMQRLILFSVNTGTWTAVLTLLSIILLHVYPTKLFYLVPSMLICPFCCNTLLANLNARTYLGGGDLTNVVDMELRRRSSSRRRTTKRHQQDVRDKIMSITSQQGIWKTTEVEVFTDFNYDLGMRR